MVERPDGQKVGRSRNDRGSTMFARTLAVASVTLGLMASEGGSTAAYADDTSSCGLPQYFQTFVEALPGRVVDLSGESAYTFLRIAELTQQPFERVIVYLHTGAADVLTVVSRGDLVCAKRISLPRDKAQWGINMAFGEGV